MRRGDRMGRDTLGVCVRGVFLPVPHLRLGDKIGEIIVIENCAKKVQKISKE